MTFNYEDTFLTKIRDDLYLAVHGSEAFWVESGVEAMCTLTDFLVDRDHIPLKLKVYQSVGDEEDKVYALISPEDNSTEFTSSEYPEIAYYFLNYINSYIER